MNILIAILIFGLVIIVHEMGHCLVAKKNGITVVEFAIGMGPTLFSIPYKGTLYSVKLLPFGGACTPLGEDGEELDAGSFNNASVWSRMATIAAGPFFNFILAFILSLIVIGISGYSQAVVGVLEEQSPAYAAGLRQGDIITKYNGVSTFFYGDLALERYLNESDSISSIELTVTRGEKTLVATIQPFRKQRYLLGFDYSRNDQVVTITKVEEGFPFDKAGLQAGDILTSINEIKVDTGEELQEYLSEYPISSEPLNITYVRDGETYHLVIEPQLYEYTYDGLYYQGAVVEASGLKLVAVSFLQVGYWIKTTIRSLGLLLDGTLGANDLSGPVGIVNSIGNTVKAAESQGAMVILTGVLNWTILISANLGVMNLLPLPALDGGRLVFLIIEAIRRKPGDRRKEGMVHTIGLLLLIGLMIFVLINDVRSLFA